MSYVETPVVFECDGDRLIGILAIPFEHQSLAVQPPSAGGVGVLILVGGPQYRAGSHRQFTLLARDLANQGIASFRFDYRGMGDSEGASRAFDRIDEDIATAIDAFFQHVPTLASVVIWGLCDAASAALMYAHRDSRVNGLILLNPWVHTEDAGAQARLKHYYLKRFIDPSFWLKLFSGQFKLHDSFSDFDKSLRAHLRSKSQLKENKQIGLKNKQAFMYQSQAVDDYFISRMLNGLMLFQHDILVILSENDLTAKEFISLVENDKHWRKVYTKSACFRQIINNANHTFSSAAWRHRVSVLTGQFVTNGVNP
ncbi:hydrolase 1, exosortase A system-associated [Allochromatium vinosum]|uniref:hydrolase 1, exosortase A system-associated n=1 Tax=Allochromatium vinosum TaxID=1049 RepID=UPI0019082FD6|nr:hydrolase 1, exosortase A system-associated [Allochromatium vinosum]MBK1655693.1 hydrolase 1, exosortase A system-associated [Allochromatium vinosum]